MIGPISESTAKRDARTGQFLRAGRKMDHGYVAISRPEHPRADKKGYIPEHIAMAEDALGHFLPPKAVVHHHDRDKANNQNSNLVICNDGIYHALLHFRMRVVVAGGNPNTHKFCTGRCKLLRPKADFTNDGRKVDGLREQCRECRHQEYLDKVARGYYK